MDLDLDLDLDGSDVGSQVWNSSSPRRSRSSRRPWRNVTSGHPLEMVCFPGLETHSKTWWIFHAMFDCGRATMVVSTLRVFSSFLDTSKWDWTAKNLAAEVTQKCLDS